MNEADLRLRDAIAEAIHRDAGLPDDLPAMHWPDANAVMAMPEIQRLLALRALVSGGPCLTCDGRGALYMRGNFIADCEAGCTDGRVPGLIERLEAMGGSAALHGDVYSYETGAAVIAELRNVQGDPAW